MSNRGKNRGSGRFGGRGGGSFSRRVHAAEDGKDGIPSVIYPSSATVLSGSDRFRIDWNVTGVATTIIRIEDIITAIRKVPSMGASYDEVIRVRIHKVWVYAAVSSSTSTLVPSFLLSKYCLLTGAPGLGSAITGTVTQPARRTYTIPHAASNQIFAWDGVGCTSATICALSTTQAHELTFFAHATYYVGRAAPPVNVTSVSDWTERSDDEETELHLKSF